MPTLTSTRNHTLPRPRIGGGGRPPVIEFPHYGGGEGGRDDRYPDFVEQLRRYRLGLMIGLVAVTMLFVAFTTTYMFRHSMGRIDTATGAYVNDWKPLRLPVGLLLANTAILLLSSFTIEKGRRQAFHTAVVAPITAMPGIAPDRDHRVPWVSVTVALGFVFLGGQYLAWLEMARSGFFIATGPSSSFFYVLTALHGVHLFGGIVALGYATLALRTKSLERRRIVVDITAWYWHFMGLLWLYVFALLILTT